MLLLVLALFWVALLAPVAIRWFRDGRGERSIESFHAEHEVLRRPSYVVAPAHRLDEVQDEELYEPPVERRPHLRVVRSDDTVGTLEARSNWDEWSEDYSFDELHEAATPVNHYARAYSSQSREREYSTTYEPPLRRRTMRQQRHMVFLSLVALATLVTVAAAMSSSSIVVDLAALVWFSVVLYVALGLYAVSQGYLNEPSFSVRLPQLRSSRAGVAMDDGGERYDEGQYVYYDEEFAPVYDDNGPYDEWQNDTERRRAFG
ncbi:MAG TPA: hypothetical protein VGG21_06195 [Acidimicrobiales bacterium]|jgi:hypothetical protein